MEVLSPFPTIEKKSGKAEKLFFGKEALKHPGRMDLGLAKEVIRVYNPSSVVDCMAGIGTTGLACSQFSDVAFLGIELNSTWMNIGAQAFERAYLSHIQMVQGDSSVFPIDKFFDLLFFSPPFPNAHSPGKGEDQQELTASLSNWAGTEYTDHPKDLGKYRQREQWMNLLKGIIYNSTRKLHGHVIVHIKNFVRDNQEVRVDLWVAQVLESLGLEVLGYHPVPLGYMSWYTKRHLYPQRKVVDSEGWTVSLECGHAKDYNPKRTKKLPKSAICVDCGQIPGRVYIDEERLVVARKV